MKADFDKETVFCNFCNQPIFPMNARTIDLETSNRYCNSYCLGLHRYGGKNDR
jgi:hypothetical protein